MRLALPCDRAAPQTARRALRNLLAAEPVCDDAILVTSELITNAVRHSACDPGDEVLVDAVIDGDCLRIAVHDPGRSPHEPRVASPPARGEGGLGLRIVEQVARRWGVERPDGRWVWAELPLS